MDGRDELLTIAEIAVGIAGFSGVIAAFVQRGPLPPVDRVRFLGVFATAFSALLLAFVPIALAYGGFQDQPPWRLSSFAMVFWSLAGLVPYPFVLPRIKAELGSSSLLPLGLFIVPTVGNLVVQVINGGAWFWQPNFVPYLVGMLTYLYTAGLFFVLIVLFRPPT